MTSENHASYARIGLTVVLGIAAIVATLVYLGGLRGHSNEGYVETYYDKPVSGLSVGSAVNLRGVKVGEVREISFVGTKYDISGPDGGRIYILMAINLSTLGIHDTADRDHDGICDELESWGRKGVLRATVTASGITGLSRIEIDFLKEENRNSPREISWQPRTLYIPPKESLMDSFSDSATKVMNQINEMNLTQAWSNLNSTVDSMARVADGINRMVEARQPELERVVQNLEGASSALGDFAEKIRENPSVLLRDVERTPLPETSK